MSANVVERVVITGGGRGIGAAIRVLCVERGWCPITLDLRGGDIECDLSDPESISSALSLVLEGGPVTRVVNNVGWVKVDSLEDVVWSDLQRSYVTNVMSHVLVTQALVPSMKASGFGRIVNISSRAAQGKVGRTAYGAAKAAVHGLTRTWALELAASGITANTVSPGPIGTEMFDHANPDGSRERSAIVESIPVGRVGYPSEVAEAVCFFLGDGASFITGQNVSVCGGVAL